SRLHNSLASNPETANVLSSEIDKSPPLQNANNLAILERVGIAGASRVFSSKVVPEVLSLLQNNTLNSSPLLSMYSQSITARVSEMNVYYKDDVFEDAWLGASRGFIQSQVAQGYLISKELGIDLRGL